MLTHDPAGIALAFVSSLSPRPNATEPDTMVTFSSVGWLCGMIL